ncbi:MAG TPA: DUF6600 domain-containing protein [Casimicrobiaceae bacterium]|nr:DUF6600 domain-containing protein [Casimicrobiaceae bacterium]
MSSMRQQWRNGMIGLIGALALLACGAALADPPTRVARLAQMSGTITFSPAGEEDWAVAQANRPVVTGDRLWADANSHFELQIGDAAVRIGGETSVNVLNLDDQVGQFQLAQGSLNLRVRRVNGDQFYEIDTPNLAFSVRKPGEYRIDVDPNGNTTTLRVRSGEGQAWGEGAAYVIGAGQMYSFTGEGLRDYSTAALPQPDEFDRWAYDRDRRVDAAVSARYVSPELIGASDLDEYGTWRDVQGYGNVWVPTSVEAGWAPYHYGHWGWVDPWGWTWIDDAPWGFAPFHYGRWAYLQSRWCWVPGPRTVRPVYAPALVAFVGGGGGFSLSVSSGPGVAWFPLGVGEVYRPSYAVSRSYFTNVNVSNTVVNTTVINNYYNNRNVNVVYRNREVPGAVVAVSTTAFASGHDVHREAVQVSREVIARQPVSEVAHVAPTRASVIAAAAAGGAAVAVAKPKAAVLERHAVAKAAPPPPPPSFQAKAQALAAQPGKPLETEKLHAMAREQRQAERNVKVVAPPSGQASAAPKPLPPAKGGPEEKRGGQPPTAAVPQPPQERGGAKEERRGPPPTAAVPQPPQERGGAKEEKRGPPPTAAVPQPPQERGVAKEERRGPPPTAAVPQPPQERGGAKEERRGPPPTAAVPPPPQERALKEEKRGPPPTAAVPQPPQERGGAKEERRSPPPAAAAPQPPQERAAKEERRGPPPAAAAPQPPQPQPQPQARQAPPPQQAQAQQPPQPQAQPQQGGKGEARREEGQGRGKEKDKEKDKDKKEGQPQ